MTILLLLPSIISALLLGAHFLRVENLGMVLLCLAVVPLLLVRRPWVARAVQAVMYMGTAVWVQTTYALFQTRAASGAPYLRMVIILGSVAAFTLLSALLFQAPRLRRRFSPPCSAEATAA